MSKIFYSVLPHRGLIQVERADRFDFLQGLVTNDMALLETQPAIYACLLTPQGKFLHDFFISHGAGDSYFIECEGGERAQDLYDRLKKYRLRADVQISVEDDVPVYAVFGGEEPAAGYPDPRSDKLGWRSFTRPENSPEKPFEEWDAHRIGLGIPDGSRDMAFESSTMEECNIKRLNGVSYEKGCYVGQELTARMHHRGLGKKHLYVVHFADTPPEPFDEITADGHLIGEMRSSCGNIGLALLKDEATDKLEYLGARLLS